MPLLSSALVFQPQRREDGAGAAQRAAGSPPYPMYRNGLPGSRSRIEGKADFTKHLILLRGVDDGKVYNVGDTVCEILLKNGDDGTSAYGLMLSFFASAA
ncbi:DUF945 domain-containing protein [Pararhizobium arenae]|uniref:DUF945 domain-containing protein n=1 Tax=Pararhizobium arenae TaxID=1856850 RepID=UPI001FDA7047|nr:DUF945 domain-containing protein [Pararhizobium arenae]